MTDAVIDTESGPTDQQTRAMLLHVCRWSDSKNHTIREDELTRIWGRIRQYHIENLSAHHKSPSRTHRGTPCTYLHS